MKLLTIAHCSLYACYAMECTHSDGAAIRLSGSGSGRMYRLISGRPHPVPVGFKKKINSVHPYAITRIAQKQQHAETCKL